MSLVEPKPTRSTVLAERAMRRRPVLMILLVLCAGFALLEPDRLVHSAVAFVAACALVLLVVPDAAPVGGQARRSQRNRVWPDGSLKAMADTLSYPAYLVSSDGILRYANRAGDDAFGPAAVGDPIAYKFRHPEIARVIGEAIAKGRSASAEFHDEVPRQRWFHMHIAPVPNPSAQRESDFFLLSFLDFTEMKRSEQMRSDFIANASHELRTPLASLRGFIETIKGPAANDKKAVRQFLGVMLEQAERMSRLIDDLLSLSRIEMKAHLRPQTNIDLADVLGHVCDSMQPMAAEHGLEITRQIEDDKLIIEGDHDELIQVFENLLENACKYGASGGRVDVIARRVNGRGNAEKTPIEVTVRDYGPGIPSEHLSRLTERFYRIDVESSREKRGTGLGLAIVKHILMRHGTRLQISSTLGQGASFTVIFAPTGLGDDVDAPN